MRPSVPAGTGELVRTPVVDHGRSDDIIAEHLAPAIRGWHMLILNYSGCCLGNLRSGVSADL
jgi:hypothetical protein